VGDEREPAVVGLLATEGLPKELAEELAEDPPDELSERFPEVEWQVDVSAEPFSEPAPDSSELVRAVRERLVREGWKLAVCLTDLPLLAPG
jgi:hypothetical protein